MSDVPRPRSVQDADTAIAGNGNVAAAVTAGALQLVFKSNSRKALAAGLVSFGFSLYATRKMLLAVEAKTRARIAEYSE